MKDRDNNRPALAFLSLALFSAGTISWPCDQLAVFINSSRKGRQAGFGRATNERTGAWLRHHPCFGWWGCGNQLLPCKDDHGSMLQDWVVAGWLAGKLGARARSVMDLRKLIDGVLLKFMCGWILWRGWWYMPLWVFVSMVKCWISSLDY